MGTKSCQFKQLCMTKSKNQLVWSAEVVLTNSLLCYGCRRFKLFLYSKESYKSKWTNQVWFNTDLCWSPIISAANILSFSPSAIPFATLLWYLQHLLLPHFDVVILKHLPIVFFFSSPSICVLIVCLLASQPGKRGFSLTPEVSAAVPMRRMSRAKDSSLLCLPISILP